MESEMTDYQSFWTMSTSFWCVEELFRNHPHPRNLKVVKNNNDKRIC